MPEAISTTPSGRAPELGLVAEARSSLARGPERVAALVRDLPTAVWETNEGGDSWSPREVVGHLIVAERALWIPRLRIVLEGKGSGRFEPFDRTAHLALFRDTPRDSLLAQFAAARLESLATLEALALDEEKLSRRAIHPELGPVTAAQLLGTWVLHDWGHLAQITRTVAKSVSPAAGPWRRYFTVLER